MRNWFAKVCVGVVLVATPTVALAQTPRVDTTPCTIAGAAMLGDGEQANPYLTALANDALYVYQRPFANATHRIVRYRVSTDAETCSLIRDEGFGAGGVLERPGIFGILGVVGDQLVVGDRGNTVYGLDGAPRYACESLASRSRIAPVDPTTALVTNGTTGVERWTFDGTTCSFGALWALPDGHQVGYHMTQWNGDLAGLYLLPERQQTIVRLAPDGTERWRWGSNQASDAAYFGNVASVALVDDTLLVLDVGRRRIWLLDGAGGLSGAIELPLSVGDHSRGLQFLHVLPAGAGVALLVYTYTADGGSSWGAVPVRL